MKIHVRPSKRYAEYIRRIKCDHWVADDKPVGNDKAVLRCVLNDATAAYGLHDGGNDWNGPRNFAADIQKGCGCQIIESRGRKKSRKAIRPSGFSVASAHSPSPTSTEVEALMSQHDELRREFSELLKRGDRSAAERARGVLHEASVVANRLRALHQPVEEIGL